MLVLILPWGGAFPFLLIFFHFCYFGFICLYFLRFILITFLFSFVLSFCSINLCHCSFCNCSLKKKPKRIKKLDAYKKKFGGSVWRRYNNVPYVWWLAGRLVTLHTRYFRFICPQCVISTFKPEIGKKNHRQSFQKLNSLLNLIAQEVPKVTFLRCTPLISLVNLTRCESVSGFCCSSMLLKSNTSHMNSMTGWAL